MYLLLLCVLGAQSQDAWRSALYPESWEPGYADSEGRFLHDFSYAGYHGGEKEIPQADHNVVNVLLPPYSADNQGRKDATKAIQAAIDAVAAQGGGVVYLPEGEYVISADENKEYCLLIKHHNVVIRGDGAGRTFIKNTTWRMREKTVFLFRPEEGDWVKPVGGVQKLVSDLMGPTVMIPVADATSFAPGDQVVLMSDCTPEFISEHKSDGMWNARFIRGVRFSRKVVAVHRANNRVEIDVPTRYWLKMRDHARIFKVQNQLEECGIEHLTIGNVENPGENLELWLKDSGGTWDVKESACYQNHASHVIRFIHAMNCWARNVSTYRPAGNKWDFHILSNGIDVYESRWVTIENCDFRKSQYEGGGGNGYMYTLEGNDCLVTGCHAEHGRHNYDFKQMSASGNVIYQCTSKDPMYSTDYHMWLSMSNLFDSFESDGDFLEANFRAWGGDSDVVHSYPTTQSVYWNIIGKRAHDKYKYLVKSSQWGWGYVIGTSGQMHKVVTTPVSGKAKGDKLSWNFDSSPEDWVEGEGKGEKLVPQSLYKDQLTRRLAKKQKGMKHE